jgi:hypothetical protein
MSLILTNAGNQSDKIMIVIKKSQIMIILITVEVMNMSRYRYRPVTFWALRYRPLPFSGQPYPTLRNVTPTLPTVTDRY